MITFFKKKSIVIQETLGERFKKIRLGKNWTIDEASRHTNITSQYLAKLETSRYEEIPGEVYIKNFIRSYSKALGINQEDALIQYAQESHIIEQKHYRHSFNGLETPPLLQRFLKPSVLKISTICLIIVLVLSYIAFNVYYTIAPPPLVVLFPTEDIEIYAPFVTVHGKSDPRARVSINEKEVTPKEDGVFKQHVTLRYGLNRIVITAQRKHGFASKEVRHVLVHKEKTMARQ